MIAGRRSLVALVLVACNGSAKPEPTVEPPAADPPKNAKSREVLAPAKLPDRVVTIEVSKSALYPNVLRVIASSNEPDFDRPWAPRSPIESTGSAVVIGPGLLLTNAHVVANAAAVPPRVARPDRAIARVTALSDDCDLALLEVVGPADIVKVAPAELATMPEVGDEVAMVGYPANVKGISIAKGVVEKIGLQRYSHSNRQLLAVTVKAAISAGNSGSPVFSHGKIAGIAFQKLTDVDDTGEMVPPPVIQAFLDGVKTGKRPEIPALGITTQNLDNPGLRKRLALADTEHGVLVLHVDLGGSADGVLEPRDIITSVDGMPIANDGTVQYLNRYRTSYHVATSYHHLGDKLRLDIKRAGRTRTVELELAAWAPLVPRSSSGAPRYLVYGGLVFQPLTRDFLTTWGENWFNDAPKELLTDYYLGNRTAQQHEVIVLTQILEDELNVGYAEFHEEAIAKLDGKVPFDMTAFVDALSSAHGMVEIETTSGSIIALDTDEVRKATPRILARHHIPRDRN
jgi:S1-C subfamily serine protease